MLQVLLLLILDLLCCCTAQQGPFQLVLSREHNLLTLNCRDSNSLTHPGLNFWINNTMTDLRELLDQRGERYSENSQFGFNFVINRDLEGLYFCGSDVNTISQMSPIVGEY